jgi:glycosyltransferase involved in cell wall biosynthesis
MQRLRIAMIGQRSIPAQYGGVERAVEELGARLVERGHDVSVFCWSADKPPAEYRGMSLKRVPAIPGKHMRALSQSVSAALRVLIGRYDVVHFHAMGPALVAPLLVVRPRMKIVSTVQGRDDRRSKWGPWAQRIIHLGAWSTAAVADETVVVSLQLQEDYASEFHRESTFIPNGISAPSLDPATSELGQFGLTPGGYLLNVGRLVPEKGIDMLPAAYQGLTTDVPMVIVGGSASTDEYVTALKDSSRLDPRVRLIGEQRGETLRQLFLNARGFVIPSHLEGLPIVLLEAISFGLPLVCSDISPITQVVGPQSSVGCEVFADGQVDALCDALRVFLGGDSAAQFQAARHRARRVLDEFSWERITDQTEAIYAKALGLRSAPVDASIGPRDQENVAAAR